MSISDRLKKELEKIYIHNSENEEEKNTRQESNTQEEKTQEQVNPMSNDLDKHSSKMNTTKRTEEQNIKANPSIANDTSQEPQNSDVAVATDISIRDEENQFDEIQDKIDKGNEEKVKSDKDKSDKDNEIQVKSDKDIPDDNIQGQLNSEQNNDFNDFYALQEMQKETGQDRLSEDRSSKEKEAKPTLPNVREDNDKSVNTNEENNKGKINEEVNNTSKENTREVNSSEKQINEPQIIETNIKEENITLANNIELGSIDEHSKSRTDVQDNKTKLNENQQNQNEKQQIEKRISSDIRHESEKLDMFGKKQPEKEEPKTLAPVGTPPPQSAMVTEMQQAGLDVTQEDVASLEEATKQFLEGENTQLEQDEQGGSYGQFKQDEFMTEDEARAKIASMLATKKNLDMMTELNDYEIFSLSVVTSVSKTYGVPIVDLFSNNLCGFKVSRGREGRREIKEVAAPNMRQQQDKKSVMEMITGARRF